MPINKFLTDSELLDIQTDAEETLLGAIMLGTVCFGDSNLIKEVALIVSPADFLDYQDQGTLSRYYTAMVACDRADIITVTHRLLDTGNYKPGDCDRLNDLLLLHYGASSYRVLDFANIVKDYSNKRGGSKKKGGVACLDKTND